MHAAEVSASIAGSREHEEEDGERREADRVVAVDGKGRGDGDEQRREQHEAPPAIRLFREESTSTAPATARIAMLPKNAP